MWPFTRKKKYTLTPTQELLLALLRAQLWFKPVDDIVLPGCDHCSLNSEAVKKLEPLNELEIHQQWDDLLNLAYKQTVVCFIAAACLRHKDVDNIPQDIREELEAVIEENKKIHEYHNEVLVELITKFEKQGLHPILLKGQGIAQMYDRVESEEKSLNSQLSTLNSQLRQCGDFDIYFLPEEFEKAKCFMQSLEEEKNMKHETYKHYGSRYKRIDVELHKHVCNFPNPFVNKRFQKWTEECMLTPSAVVINDVKISVPEPIYGLVSVFAHMWHHFENGDVSLRQLCDIEMMYAHILKNKDISDVNSSMKKCSLFGCWNIVCCLFVDVLGMQSNSCKPLAKSMRKKIGLMLSYILEDGGFVRCSKIKKALPSTRLGRWMSNQKAIISRTMKYYPLSGNAIYWRLALREEFGPYVFVKELVESGKL